MLYIESAPPSHSFFSWLIIKVENPSRNIYKLIFIENIIVVANNKKSDFSDSPKS